MSDRTIRVGWDIGGVISKYPDVFRPIFKLLNLAAGIEVYVVSDMKPHEKAVAFCRDNGFDIAPERVVCADYQTNGERCKEVVCEEHRIDVLIDDHMGYLMTPDYGRGYDRPTVRLLVMPDPDRPYYHDSWKTDGSEGIFGRRNPAGSKRPPEGR